MRDGLGRDGKDFDFQGVENMAFCACSCKSSRSSIQTHVDRLTHERPFSFWPLSSLPSAARGTGGWKRCDAHVRGKYGD